ncbi:pyridoxal phosphate-dependent aminotransferase, partial [candidate division KSB1 bacterium]|nr:pyridoxal phosphate-dependent aminotransferase [candidate division KSB1 bacterium]
MYPERVKQISPFIVMEVLEKAQQMERTGENIIHLEVGEPDFDTPAGIIEAAREALKSGDTHYTHSLGIWELRE